jgi:hypothetical protein
MDRALPKMEAFLKMIDSYCTGIDSPSKITAHFCREMGRIFACIAHHFLRVVLQKTIPTSQEKQMANYRKPPAIFFL